MRAARVCQEDNSMSAAQVEIQGVLHPDGTLVLNEKPNLPPGPVRVILEPRGQAAPPAESLLDFVQRVQRDSLARGERFMSDEELAAWIDELRADDDRIERAYRDAEGRQDEE
jgi:hypothetical protein